MRGGLIPATGSRPVSRRREAGAASLAAAALLVAMLPVGCAARPERTLEVMASAYTSHVNQTSEEPWIAAWGDTLHPNMKVIAVSRDLIEQGLTRGTRVRIEGLPGEYVVLDKMAKRWRRKIDIYMGEDVQAARQWGVRTVRIRWQSSRPDEP
jgi:3D (Asp-Asp-Asp) domain-containing protein